MVTNLTTKISGKISENNKCVHCIGKICYLVNAKIIVYKGTQEISWKRIIEKTH